jgi:hypothetical protein
MWEIILKNPIKLCLRTSLASQIEVLRIKTNRLGTFKILEELGKKFGVTVSPELVFTIDHPEWIDFEKTAEGLSALHVPINNIAEIKRVPPDPETGGLRMDRKRSKSSTATDSGD